MSIRAFRVNQHIQEYGLYADDGSWVDSFQSWDSANNFAKKMNAKSKISKIGKIAK